MSGRTKIEYVVETKSNPPTDPEWVIRSRHRLRTRAERAAKQLLNWWSPENVRVRETPREER